MAVINIIEQMLFRLSNWSYLTPSSTLLLVAIFGLLVWVLYYLHGSLAYVAKGSIRGRAMQAVCFIGSVAIFVLQVNLLNRFAPSSSHGSRFFLFIIIECGGAIFILFYSLLKARKRVLKP